MNTSTAERLPRAASVAFTDDEICLVLQDGRKLSVPLAWFPRLADASRDELNHFELIGDGEGIHWPDVDEDISVEGLLK